jgi:hypothetical protein
MNHAYLTTECINERNKALTKAGEGIVAARKSLDQLEEILSGTVTGNVPDIGQVADTTHRLREEIDQILIGLVESSMVKRDER